MTAQMEDQPDPPWWVRLLIGRRPLRTLVRLGVLVLLCVVWFRYVVLHIQVSGPSMLPTFVEGQRTYVNQLAYVWRPPQRGDVVTVKMAGKKVLILKRVIGLPGERLQIDNNVVHINGDPLDEPYVKLWSTNEVWRIPERLLGPQEYYLIGDNRSMPQDYHDFGKAKRSQIVGRVAR